MFFNEHTNSPHARKYRKAVRTIQRAASAEDRREAAQSKRERKAEKRARDHMNSVVGEMQARERVEGRRFTFDRPDGEALP